MTESYTPQTNAPRVLVLGAGEMGKETALAFHSLGVNVHVAGSYKNAPGAQVAPNAYALDLGDEEQLCELIEVVRPDFIVPAADGLNIAALSKFTDKKAGVVPSARALDIAFDRESIRTVAADELGIPTARYGFASSEAELRVAVGHTGFPCIIKSVTDTQNQNHLVLEDESQLASVEIHDRVMVEAVVDYDVEITLLVGRSINAETGALSNWFCEPIGHMNADGGLRESWQPVALSEATLDNARSVAARITNQIGGRGLFAVDLFVSGEDIYFSGVSPRPHAAGLVTLGTQRFSQFDLHARAVLGLPLDVTLTTPGACCMITADKKLDEVYYSGIPDALSVPESDLRLFGKRDAYPGRKMGAGLATAEDTDTARIRARSVAAAISLEG
ncbi:formate-dependent phosphoribosylglycinamide formyltransferase [Corynebacterium sp. ZY180755]